MKIFVQAKDKEEFKGLVFQDSREAYPGATLIFQKNSPREVECVCENRKVATYIWPTYAQVIGAADGLFRFVRPETIQPKPEKRKFAAIAIIAVMAVFTGLTFFFLKIFMGVL